MTCSAEFWAIAEENFPPGGSTEGTPGLELFMAGPLQAAIDLFALAFEDTYEIVPGVRAWETVDLPFFPAIAFYATLGDDDDSVELMSLTVDEDYWEQVDDDPL